MGWVGSWYGLVEILKLNSRPLINQSIARVGLELLKNKNHKEVGGRLTVMIGGLGGRSQSSSD